ncbi:MAG: glycosyltransferase family 4 protein [Chloroflexia bacterium]|nr:glycosyltransferase family 4 protein [Chloroflexia bacterium]
MSKKPTIGFDAFFLENPMTGMGQYALHLWQEIRQCDDFNALLLMPADAPDAVHDLAEGRAVSVAPPVGSRLPAKARKLWWEQVGVAAAARRAQVDLVHVPYFSAPLRQAAPFIVTVHDAIPFVLKEYAGGRAMGSYLKLVSRAVRGARLILTDSLHSAGDIQRYLGIPSGRIRAIPLAVGSEFTPASGGEDAARIEFLRERFGLTRPFVLNVGGFDRRKNLPALVEGFAMALPAVEQETDLVIVGSPHSGNVNFFPPLEPVINRHGLGDRVKLTGFVSEQDKLDLYRAATAFVFTSTYEGFGLNPLEAMACGTPVISSNRSSLPEVVGDGGILIDPTPGEIAAALAVLLNDANLQEALRQRGLEQAHTFSWSETARQTVQAYRDVLDNER